MLTAKMIHRIYKPDLSMIRRSPKLYLPQILYFSIRICKSRACNQQPDIEQNNTYIKLKYINLDSPERTKTGQKTEMMIKRHMKFEIEE